MKAIRTGLPANALPPLRPPQITPLARCWACGAGDLAPAHRERIDLGNLGHRAGEPQIAAVFREYHGRSFLLRRCRRCGFLQPEGVPAHADFFKTVYDIRWPADFLPREYESPYKDYIFRTVLDQVARRCRGAGRRLLDVGTHVGKMLHLAREAGWQAEGVELNPLTASYAALRTGLPVHRSDAGRLAQTGARYDVVVLTDVLEHLPEPVRVLALLRSLLVPGGWIAIKVPYGSNQRWKELIRCAIGVAAHAEIATNMCHINHFTPAALRAALGRAGFGRVDLTAGAPELPPGGGLRGRLRRGFRLAVYHAARLTPGGTRTPLALNLQVYAQNPPAADPAGVSS